VLPVRWGLEPESWPDRHIAGPNETLVIFLIGISHEPAVIVSKPFGKRCDVGRVIGAAGYDTVAVFFAVGAV